MAGGLKFRIKEVEGLYYLCSEIKGADQLGGYREADLHLCFRICKNRFSHDAAQKVRASDNKINGGSYFCSNAINMVYKRKARGASINYHNLSKVSSKRGDNS